MGFLSAFQHGAASLALPAYYLCIVCDLHNLISANLIAPALGPSVRGLRQLLIGFEGTQIR